MGGKKKKGEKRKRKNKGVECVSVCLGAHQSDEGLNANRRLKCWRPREEGGERGELSVGDSEYRTGGPSPLLPGSLLPPSPPCFCMQIPLVRIHLFTGSYGREGREGESGVHETKIVAFIFVLEIHLEC